MCHVDGEIVVFDSTTGCRDGIVRAHIMIGDPFGIEDQSKITNGLVNGGNSPAFKN